MRTYVPPTQEALKQHIKFDTHQSICWMKVPTQELPDPANWGDGKEVIASGWELLWSIMPEASQAGHELVHYECNKGCINF